MRTSALSLGLLGALLAPTARAAEPPANEVTIRAEKDRIDFKVGPQLVASYHIGAKVAKPYFWPVNVPGGTPVTRGWPMADAKPGELTDHVHQKSLWFCHGDVIPEGIDVKQKIRGITGVDFWSEHVGHGKIVCTEVKGPGRAKTKGGAGHAAVETRNEWQTADGQKIMDETRVIHLYALGDAHLLVLDIDLHASVCPITFGDTKEGSLGVRVRTDLTSTKGKGVITNAEGKTGEGAGGNKMRTGCWGLASDWCDYSGTVEEGAIGIAVLADPSNPTPTCWHVRGYGLMGANPFGRARSGFPAMQGRTDLVKLARGEHLKLRYGILLHRGDVKAGKVAEHFKEFCTP